MSALPQPEPSSSSSSKGGRGVTRNVYQRGSVVPFPRPYDDEEEEGLLWATSVEDLRAKLRACLGLHPVQVEEALRFPGREVEGAALKTLFLEGTGSVRRSRQGFFFRLLHRGDGWDAKEVHVYLEAERGGPSSCDHCPTVGVCPHCGSGEPGVWRGRK